MPAADLGADDDSGEAQEANLPQKPHHLLLPHQIPQIGPTKIAFPTLNAGQLITHWLKVSCFSNNTAYSPVRLWSPEAVSRHGGRRHSVEWAHVNADVGDSVYVFPGWTKRACKQAGFLGTEGSKLMKLCKVYIWILHIVDPRPQTSARDVRVSMCCCCCLGSDWVGLVISGLWCVETYDMTPQEVSSEGSNTHTYHDDTTGPERGDCMLADGGSGTGQSWPDHRPPNCRKSALERLYW